MPAEVFDAHLLHEFEASINFGFGVLKGVWGRTEALIDGATAEHIDTVGAEVMPPSHREWEMLGHLFAEDHFISVVELESIWVFGSRSFIFDGFHEIKVLSAQGYTKP